MSRGKSAAIFAIIPTSREGYTRLVDIECELRHYRDHFFGKTVLCNCDDPRVSNFFHYFSYKFENLGLKRLIATCYKNQERDLFSRNDCERAIWLEYTGDKNGNRIPDPEEIGIRYFNGDGDFRSDECIELLKQSDVVVTNPPFSLFREYVAQLVKYGKKFLILGNKNAITYKEIFPLIAENKLWVGVTPMSREMYFDVPQSFIDEALSAKKDRTIVKVDGKYMARSQSIWFTNLDVITWVKTLFPKYRREMKSVEWGTLYNEFNKKPYDPALLEAETARLMADDDVQRKSGIYEYLLSGKVRERTLSIRTFSDSQKRSAFEKQNGICQKCGKAFPIEEMQADHITPWAKGGHTTPDNCQMLCADCNRRKSAT